MSVYEQGPRLLGGRHTVRYIVWVGRETARRHRLSSLSVMLLFEIHYLPTARSRKVRVAGIYADNQVQARRFLRQKFNLRMREYKVINCEAIA